MNNKQISEAVTQNLLNKEAYLSIVVFWLLLTLRSIVLHSTSHFQLDVNIFFEICIFLFPTAFISSNKIHKNVNVKEVFNKRITIFLFIICTIFTVLGCAIIALCNYFMKESGALISIILMLICHLLLIVIISAIFNFWVTLQLKVLSSDKFYISS
ncbi:hypothetical protein ACVCGQ_14755 (plasmid) [Staphylococcus aureus]|nr:hypothetical protein [Staphylococcus aureus]HEJ6841780.1 hypothetical protein [Staphylococcus aureus]